MKFLVDAHLPPGLCALLRAAGHDAESEMGRRGALPPSIIPLKRWVFRGAVRLETGRPKSVCLTLSQSAVRRSLPI